MFLISIVIFGVLAATLILTPALASISSSTNLKSAENLDRTSPVTTPGRALFGPILTADLWNGSLLPLSAPLPLGTTYTWNQTGTAAWGTAANWTPSRTTPAVDDVLVFNNGSTTTVTNLPTQTIGQLLVSGNTTVNLQAAAAVTLTISGGSAGLSVAPGSALNCNANNAISIGLAAGTTGSISGSITFSATANTTHNLTAVSASGIIFNSGSVFTQGLNNTGNVFGSGTSNSIVFASGSTFVQKAGSNPFQKGQPASVVVFQTGSLFSHQMSGAPSFSGRTYANFELNAPGASPSVSGGSAVVIDNLTITAGTLNWGMTGTPGHTIKGNISVASGQTLNFNPTAIGTVNLSGTSAQTISGPGIITTNTNQTIAVNNANGISLQKDLTINGGLTLTAGNITVPSNTLSISSTGSLTRTSGHVIGNLLKVYAGVGSKTFEVGSANGYSPVTINATAGTFPANLTVKATQGPQPNFPAPSKALQRYWTLTGTGVTANLTFSYLASDVPGTADENNFVIFKYNGTLTQPPGGSVSAATHTATINGVSSFSDWTCAQTLGTPVANCPTPLSTNKGTATSEGVSAIDADGTVTSASIVSTSVPGITLDNFVPAPTNNTSATATLNVAATTAPGTYNVTIQYSNNDPTPETATCTIVVNVINQQISPNCPTPLTTTQGSATSEGVSATDPDGTVTGASITSTPVAGITLDSFVPSASNNTAATANLNVASSTAAGTYNVVIQYSNNDSPTAQTATCTVVVTVQPPPPPANTVVISQVYGGGGNTGATLKNDYIELINHSASPVNLGGWSVQAFVSTTSTWQVTPLPNFTLQPGQYFLIQESQGAGGTDNLPAPDAMGSIPVSSTSTKVALVNNTTTITSACPNAGDAGIVDLVGYGPTDCFEGSGTAPTLDNTTADLRRNEGCFDTNDNAHDFITGSPNPRNTSSPTHNCTSLSAYGSANPSSVLQGNSTTFTVYVAGAQNPDSTGITVSADLSQIGGSASQSFSGSGSVFSFATTVPANNSTGMKSLPVTVTDGQSRTFSTSILLSVLPLVADHLTISQVYGGGGNSGATYTNDYVELYNPTANSITITGWSLQYASAAGTSWTNKQPLGGVIGPGQYYLVALSSGGANGSPLPLTPNISGDINMSATTGKIALVNNSSNLSGGCPLGADPDIVDFVGYGTGATCHEGSANTSAPGNSTAIFRKNSGSLDADQNGTDFQTGTPSPRRTAPIVELGPWVSGTDPGTDANTIPYDATITVNFSEPVTVDPGWYHITCTVTGAHNSATEAHFSDLKSYAFTPNTSFQFGEQCTVAITKTAVHDVDIDDSGPDTDTLFADYTWSFTVVGAGQAAPYPPSVHLTMGNPSNATASLSDFDNYLMQKPTYSLSYNRDKGTPNWVSWHLDSSWYGTLARVDTFRPDPAVDPSWYRVQGFDYSGSGFDRGHMTPNADRDNQNRIPINQETYLMSNMVPQAPDNNQGPWAALEAYLRTQTDAGSEIYIVSGPNGVGGVGSASINTVTTIANGHVTVPSSTWKVALVLPQATGDDTARVTCSTRTIAVIMPNVQGIRSNSWETYLTTVDAVEQLTGYDFFSNLPPAVQACIEGGTNGTNPSGTANQSASTTEDNSVTVTLQALQSNNNTLTFTIMGGPSSGSLGGVSASTCSAGTCTATVTYTPAADVNGSDSFTFRANDGSVHSNTSTVTIGVSEVNDSPTAADDSKSAQEDTPLTFSASDLAVNDSAGPNESTQALTITSVTGNANTHGTVALDSGMVTYTPAANFNGPASFTYTVCDDGTTNGLADSKCATATVNVNVAAVNDNPTATDDSATTNEDTPVNVTVLTNDSDLDGDSLTVSAVTQGTHGSVTTDGTSVTYAPAANFNGNDTFTYTIADGHGGTATASVNVTINAVNDAPVAANDSATTDEDTPLNVNVLLNDSDVDTDSLAVSALTPGSHGSVVNNGSSVTYSPAANYNGTDSFTYTVSDGHGGTATANVSITIDAVNDNPDAVNDSATTDEDTAATVNVLNNDSDVDNDLLTVSAVTQGSHGSVVNNGNNVIYSPAANYNGTDSFTYTVSDGHGGTATASVSVTINAVNDAPVANDDSATTNEDTPVGVNVLVNDSDVDGDPLTVSAVTQGAHGSVTTDATSVTYAPAANFNGNDSFTYTITDGHGGTAIATVSVTINPVNDSPVATNDSATTNEDTSVSIEVLTNDSDVDADVLTISAVTQGSHGLVVNNSIAVSYSPAANFNGTDSFTYIISDGHGGTATAEVSVTINAVNDAPVANNDSATTNEDTSVTVNVLNNDSDVDGDSLTVSAVTQGTHGSVTTDGASVTYAPAANFNGNDTFTYTIADGHGGTATASVSVTVNAVNDAPVANDDSASTNEDTAVSVNVLSNDSDVDHDPLSISNVTQASHGSVANNGTSVSYSPAANYNGSDSFTYTISDGDGGAATATVSVTIYPVNDNPVAVADSATTNEDNSVTIDVVANDTDVDGNALSLASVGTASHGSVSILSGKAVYSPTANFNGADSFSYVVSDGQGGQANGTVSVIINPVNDAPTADSQAVNTNSNTPVAIALTGSDLETPSGSLTFTVTSGPSHGSLSGSGPNRAYTPGLNYSGPDSFKFTITDTGDGSSPALTSSEATVSITVHDTVGPTITLNGHSISLWPPNHSYHTINVSDLVASASDNFDLNLNLDSVVIAQVTSDEIENGNGDGNTLNDIVIASNCKSVQLRSERDGGADGRVYTITFAARDATGNLTNTTAIVTVPKNSGGNAVDSGLHYIVHSICP
ncbi:MAG: Ig-like domain-containing protein [Pyrinomonadaceae bacterium]